MYDHPIVTISASKGGSGRRSGGGREGGVVGEREVALFSGGGLSKHKHYGKLLIPHPFDAL